MNDVTDQLRKWQKRQQTYDYRNIFWNAQMSQILPCDVSNEGQNNSPSNNDEKFYLQIDPNSWFTSLHMTHSRGNWTRRLLAKKLHDLAYGQGVGCFGSFPVFYAWRWHSAAQKIRWEVSWAGEGEVGGHTTVDAPLKIYCTSLMNYIRYIHQEKRSFLAEHYTDLLWRDYYLGEKQ